ncbi:MAG: tRNA uridine-5-carboxymethylaminomethyl(34) synthesis GTPase MnmE [Candidatus Omnitrophica bacterium]|nr:tRNA uridine-5-carboxymethylaminomethyl(34) synthesis GTPase MnmE [Candidatus Omnitrophota bacterium]
MLKINLSDTIAAISTPLGESGIGIVRLSGKEALSIADKIFVSKNGRRPSEFKSYTLHYGWIVDRRMSKDEDASTQTSKYREIIDEVLLSVMRAPYSYTKEDIVEINCHGGIVALRKVLDLVLENGARLAEPGEFTQRAFLNGRIDLAQAEAVLDIIRAKTDSALKIAIEQLKGTFSQQIKRFRKTILDILTVLEANIDFPDEEIGRVDLERIRERLVKMNQELKNIIDHSRYARILREGIQVVICGKPNVGKSSLLNALLKTERSIVTPVAGTTRDTIEEVIDIKGIAVKIVDTAGIIEPRDLVQRKAIQRAKKQIDRADLIILVFDGTRRLSPQDRMLMARLKKRQTLAVINKIDCKQKIDKTEIIKEFKNIIEISAKKLKNITLLEETIANLIFAGKVVSPEPFMVANLRHIQAIKETQKFIEEALDSLDNRLSIEFIAQGLKDALGLLDGILGRRFTEDLLDKVFSEFCIGK